MPIVTDDTENSGFTFTMELTEVERTTISGVPDVIFQTRWRLTGEKANPEGGDPLRASFDGATPLLYRDRLGTINTQGFEPGNAIAYADLTEAQVIAWIEERLNGDLHPFEHIVRQLNAMGVTRSSHLIDTTHENLPWESEEN